MNDGVKKFNVPIVVFTFKRLDTTIKILNRIKTINPDKLYIISDAGRNSGEDELVSNTRKEIERYLQDWNTTIIYDYAKSNRGVYKNIALGAKKVLEKEKWAIFLEDDNLPSYSFFEYCKELLIKYENQDNIIWICGTNYLGENDNKEGSYVFTQHLLPCGWASWSNKFLKNYQFDFSKLNNQNLKKIKKRYFDYRLYYQQKENWLQEKERESNDENYFSWDYHMSFSLKLNDLYGISPDKNLIRNIGVDMFSTHGGTSYDDEMTKRFCSIEEHEMLFPLEHPTKIEIDEDYERKVSDIILYPLKRQIKYRLVKGIKLLLNVPLTKPIKDIFKKSTDNTKYTKGDS